MFKFVLGMICAVALCWTIGAQDPALPPNHPQMPQMPPSHPPVNPAMPPNHPQLPAAQPQQPQPGELQPPPEPRPEDVESIDSIVRAYYETVSGEKGKARDWNRLRSLMFPDLRFVTARPLDNDVSMPMVLSIDQFIEVNKNYFERGGYYEKEIHREVDAFGKIAQVFSTYETRRDIREEQPYSRGINSIQLLNDGMRWWIVNILWDFEKPDVNPVPPEYGGTPKQP